MKIDIASIAELVRETPRAQKVTPALLQEVRREVERLIELGSSRMSIAWANEVFLATRSRIQARRIAAVVVLAMLHFSAGQPLELAPRIRFVEDAK